MTVETLTPPRKWWRALVCTVQHVRAVYCCAMQYHAIMCCTCRVLYMLHHTMQDLAARLLLEIQRVAYGEAVVSRSPELVAASSPAAGTLVVTLPNASLVTHAGTFVGDTATCSKAPANTTAGMQFPRVGNNGALVPVGFAIDGANVTASCDARGAPVRCTSTATPPRASCTAQRRGCRRSRSKPTARQPLQRRWPSALLPATTR